MKKTIVASLLLIAVNLCVSSLAFASQAEPSVNENLMDELDPFDPNIEQLLQEYDSVYESETGMPAHLDNLFTPSAKSQGCYRLSCSIYIQVSKSEQRLYYYLNGRQEASWPVSTGTAGRSTPDMDTHPNGRIYDAYTSTKYPEGDYQGLGNMPYAFFIQGGFAIHGTTKGNWPKLGRPASHGCIRLHPDNAKILNRLVRQYGVRDVWVSVQ